VKLVTTIDRTLTGPVLLAPIVDGLLIVVVFFLFGSHLTSPTGIPVELPRSSLQFVPHGEAHLLVVSAESLTPLPGASVADAANPPHTSVLVLDGARIRLPDLADQLRDLRSRSERKTVILQADKLCTHGLVVEITNAVLSSGFELVHATSPAP